MIRRLLLPLDNSPSAYSAMQYAVDLYHRHKSFLSAMAIIDRPGIEKAMTSMGIGASNFAKEGREDILHAEEKKAYDLLAYFGDLCQQEGIPHVDREIMDAPLNALIGASHYVDVIVMGVSSCQPYNQEDETATVKQVAKEASCPILSTPNQYRPIRKVAICFDGSVPAARVMHQYVYLHPFATEDLFLVSADGGSPSGRETLDQAALFLRSHGLFPQTVMLSGRARVAVPEFVEQQQIDLVVLGPHSGTIKKLFFGSLSEKLFQRRDVALFMYD